MIIKESFNGELVPFDDGVALRLGNSINSQTVYLAYALVTQGPELQILPSALLDDWGNEISGLRLYEWIEENGLKFPRAEVFGVDTNGRPVQYFLRDLELFGKYPVYAFSTEDSPDDSGRHVGSILMVSDVTTDPVPAQPPDGISRLLRRGKVNWWLVGPE